MLNPNAQTAALAAMHKLIASGDEIGLQVAAYHNGQLVVDACIGTQFNPDSPAAALTPDSLFVVFSVSKGITTHLLHIMAERGLIDYDTPIAHYWPEFAANGKAEITVAQALTHQSGLAHMPDPLTLEQMLDWGYMTRWLAAEAPLWPPGSAMGYHALTYGWLIGEIIQRVDGRPLAEILQAEICRPLGIDRLFFGLPDALLRDVIRLQPSSPPPADAPSPHPIAVRSVPMSLMRPSLAMLKACLPASGGIANARSLAKAYAGLVGDGVDGVRLLPPERVAIASKIRAEGTDFLLRNHVRRALGYGCGGADANVSGYEYAFGHVGAGGFVASADPSANFAFALCKSRMFMPAAPQHCAIRIVEKAVRDALGIQPACHIRLGHTPDAEALSTSAQVGV